MNDQEAPSPKSFESFDAVEISMTFNDNTDKEQMSCKVKLAKNHTVG